MKITIRDIKKEDYPFVLRINEENVEVLSPMDEAKLEYFVGCAEQVLVAEVDGERAAFCITLREGEPSYTSENYIWFSKTYSQFLYIDRIVIDEPFRKMGLGRKLYEEVFRHARETGVKRLTAEVDTIPYNEASLKFHDEMGFREVGEQIIRGGSIKVSLKAVEV